MSNETWKSKRKWVVIKIGDGVVRNKENEGKRYNLNTLFFKMPPWYLILCVLILNIRMN